MALAGTLIAVVVISALFHIATPNNVATVVLGFVLGMAPVTMIAWTAALTPLAVKLCKWR